MKKTKTMVSKEILSTETKVKYLKLFDVIELQILNLDKQPLA